ncbi:hypothetical protein PTTG_27500 [Puccinia triticina 1-1 BBBD Race 1]|uniref:Secreted protein n=2 Tax=Puccinia triticina TaxID=208348 RepID=A0A180GJ79_PUCT1|nr:uncharacterized protein PtA15_14A302 [Puccinia triticina]OAV92836.1 hypothetical protein PTTG_27500 [Puccinia triticina 1-1 BBBD Race 1]WAQ91418.1 hypothetical protein PtA15_14A302 [Puccinia triticina]
MKLSTIMQRIALKVLLLSPTIWCNHVVICAHCHELSADECVLPNFPSLAPCRGKLPQAQGGGPCLKPRIQRYSQCRRSECGRFTGQNLRIGGQACKHWIKYKIPSDICAHCGHPTAFQCELTYYPNLAPCKVLLSNGEECGAVRTQRYSQCIRSECRRFTGQNLEVASEGCFHWNNYKIPEFYNFLSVDQEE